MSFKRFLVCSSGSPPVCWSRTIYAILKEGIMGIIHVKLYGIWTSGSEDVIKDISYLELWQPLCSVDQNHLCNFGRRCHEVRFCEIILNLYQWFRRKCRLKLFFPWSLCSPFVRRSVTTCAILVKGIMRNNSVKLF